MSYPNFLFHDNARECIFWLNHRDGKYYYKGGMYANKERISIIHTREYRFGDIFSLDLSLKDNREQLRLFLIELCCNKY